MYDIEDYEELRAECETLEARVTLLKNLLQRARRCVYFYGVDDLLQEIDAALTGD